MSGASNREFAIELIQIWRPIANQPKNAISAVVPLGAKGWAHPATNPNTQTWVEVDLPDYSLHGLLPRNYLNIGVRKGIRIEGSMPGIQTMTMRNDPASLGDDNVHVLAKTLRGLLLEMTARTTELGSLGSSPPLLESLRTKNVDYMQVMKTHMVPQAIRILKNGDFGFNDLLKLPSIDQDDKDSGIYIIAYKDIGNMENAIYVGKTVNFVSRMSSHKDQIESTGLMTAKAHYSVARKAKSWRMMPFFRFASTTPQLDSLLKMVEQVSVMLMSSYNGRLLLPIDSWESASAHAQAIVAAQTFSSISKIVFEQTRWPLSIAQGLNWSSPLTEIQYARTIWNVTILPNKRIYRRGPLSVLKHSQDWLQLELFRGDRNFDYVSFSIPGDRGLKYGDKVFPVIEMMTDGSSHPIHYTRFPIIGPFSDWSRVNSFGVYVDWKAEDGKWKRTWLEHRQINIGPSDLIPEAGKFLYSFKAYRRLSYLLDTLERIQYTQENPAPTWRLRIRPIALKHVDFHHLTQNVTVRDIKIQKQKNKISMLSFEQNEQALRKHYPGIIIGVDPKDVFESVSAKRKICDYCYISLGGSSWGKTCKLVPDKQLGTKFGVKPGTKICQHCFALRRPCTFTEAANITARRWETLGPRRPHDAVYDIDGFVKENMALGSDGEDDDDLGSEGDDDDDDDNYGNKGESSVPLPKAETAKERAQKSIESKKESRKLLKNKYYKTRKDEAKSKPRKDKDGALSKKTVESEDDDDDDEEDEEEDETQSFQRKQKAASKLRKGKGRAKQYSESEYEEGDNDEPMYDEGGDDDPHFIN